MTDTISRPRLLFVEEVATELRRSVAAVRWYINSGKLKAGKVGGRVVVKPADLDAFIESGFSA